MWSNGKEDKWSPLPIVLDKNGRQTQNQHDKKKMDRRLLLSQAKPDNLCIMNCPTEDESGAHHLTDGLKVIYTSRYLPQVRFLMKFEPSGRTWADSQPHIFRNLTSSSFERDQL